MPRKRIESETRSGEVSLKLAAQLSTELKSAREFGQPFIYERAFRTGKLRVLVIWDAFEGLTLQDRSATILRAYELAEGVEYQDRIALASGLTVPEAHAAGMLPYQLIAAVRQGDPLSLEQAREAMLSEGGSKLFDPARVQLRFAEYDEVEAARQRLIEQFPGTEEVWLVDSDVPLAHRSVSDELAEANEAS